MAKPNLVTVPQPERAPGLNFYAEPAMTKGGRCGIGACLESLDGNDREALLQVLGDPEYDSTRISRVLKAAGKQIGPDAVRRHRRGECACDPR